VAKKNDRIVYQRDDGSWVNKRVQGERASGIHTTQGDAAAQAKEQIHNAGGGELIIKGRDGKIRSKDTITPGNDPRSIKDREH
jgi:hypothetical protein